MPINKTIGLTYDCIGSGASIALYLPALPDISKAFAISQTDVKLTVTYFIIGFGISPMVYGPISDKIGRKKVLIISLLVALTGYAGNLAAPSLYLFLLCRLLEGLGFGGLLTSGRAIVRDVFSGKELASASSYLSMGFAIGFGLSPVIAGNSSKQGFFHKTPGFRYC